MKQVLLFTQLFYTMAMIEILKRQNHESSHMVMEHLSENEDFRAMAGKETAAILQRDKDDDIKLREGIRLSVEAGVISPLDNEVCETVINVEGKSPAQVGNQIISELPENEAALIIVTGLSGTGKGTTVAYLLDAIPESIAWSNGDLFRCFTLLLLEKNFISDNIDHKHIKEAADSMTVVYGGDQPYDITLPYRGGTVRLSEIRNTLLKERRVSTRIPQVALYTQGEVILTAGKIVNNLLKQGHSVIMEGRKATLDYFDSPWRFSLELSDPGLLGRRRAAQKIAARALEILDDSTGEIEAISRALELLKKDEA